MSIFKIIFAKLDFRLSCWSKSMKNLTEFFQNWCEDRKMDKLSFPHSFGRVHHCRWSFFLKKVIFFHEKSYFQLWGSKKVWKPYQNFIKIGVNTPTCISNRFRIVSDEIENVDFQNHFRKARFSTFV